MTIEKLKSLEPIFGAWYVDSKLAEGRSSKVFKVYKTINGVTEHLALKTVKFPANDKELSRVIESGKYKTVGEYLDTLEKAVTDNMNKMLSLRTNKNIVRFDNFQIIKESSCFYVVMLMELLYPFSEKVKANDITPDLAAKIGCDLCSAAEGFRSIGIMHHQIKPENIYIDSEGKFKLGDFGISNIAGRTRTEASPYMAPEIYKGSAYDTSSDIYSIGVLLYKLLNNNRLPFLPEYPNPVSLSDRELAFEKQLRGEIPLPPAKADVEMAKIISKALAHLPTDRFFKPALMKAEIERYTEALYIYNEDSSSAYEPDIQPPVYIPVAPVPPVSGFSLAEDINEEDGQDTSIYLNPEAAVSEAEKTAFREAFKESVDDADEDDEKDNKKLYLLVAGIIAIVALVIALIFFGGDSDDTTDSSAILPTVSTTQPPTVMTTVPPTVITTENSTVESTTEEITTEETTTEETTDETTAEETTTEEITFEETTAEETTVSVPAEIPELVVSGFSDGDESSDGKIYTSIEDYTLIQTPEDEFFDEVILEISTPLGDNIKAQGDIFIYEMAGSSVIQKIKANSEITLSESDGEQVINCYITVDDGDFYYSPEYYQYYVCLDEGALVSDSLISLPLQLQI